MATEYINPDFTGGSNDGSLSNPWTSWANVTVATGNTYLQKRGTIDTISAENKNFPTSHEFDDATVTIGAYYNETTGADEASYPLPIIRHYITNTDSSGWTQPDASGYPNVWKYTFDELINGARRLLALGSLDLVDGKMTSIRDVNDQNNNNYFVDPADGTTFDWTYAPSQEGDYCQFNGVNPEPAAIYIYSEGNPVTKYGTVYMTCHFYPVFQPRNPTAFTLTKLKFEYCGSPIRILANTAATETTGTVEVADCIFSKSRRGVQIYANDAGYTFTSIKVQDNTCLDLLQNSLGITAGAGNAHFTNVDISGNYIRRTGYDFTTGGIYIGESESATAATPLLIYDNDIEYVYAGTMAWPSEGGAIYLDSTNSYSYVFANRIANCRYGGQDNSGSITFWFGNLWINCNQALNISDAGAVDALNVTVDNNTFVDCGRDDIPAADSNGANKTWVIVKYDDNAAATASNYQFRNNRFIGYSATQTEGIRQSSTMSGNEVIVESNNSYLNIDDDLKYTDGGATPIAKTNEVTGDLGVTGTFYQLEGDNPLIRAGLYVDNNKYKDYLLRPFKIPPNVGCYEQGSRSPAKLKVIA